MKFHINYPLILSKNHLKPENVFLFGWFSLTLLNYKQTGLRNKSSLLAGQRFGNLSSCQVLIGTDPILVPLTSAKLDGPV